MWGRKMEKRTKAIYKGEKMRCTRLFIVSYSGYGFPEWNEIVCEHELKKLLQDCEKHGWVRPDVFPVETIEVLEDEE